MLIRIGRTIARYDRALLQNRRYTGNHNHTERAVAGHESDIRKERGLSDSKSDTFGAGRNNADEIRSVAEELSEKSQEGDLHGTSSERRTADTLPGDTGTGRGEVRGTGTEVVEEPDRDGGTETERSAAVDEGDEPDLSAGRGDRSEGTGLSVEELEQYEPPADSPYRQMDLFSLMSEQVGNIAMAQAEMPSDRFLFGTITAGQKMWREVRKRGGICTGMSQNLIDAQRNRSTKTMVSNSEFMLLLDQGTMDKEAVEDLFDISSEQLACVNGADPGMGLIRFGDKIVPFDNTMEKDSSLYQLFNTNFHEMVNEKNIRQTGKK